jgi:hypothetical protein
MVTSFARACALCFTWLAPALFAAEEPTRAPGAAALEEKYFAIGPWRIGSPREEALKHFNAAEAVDGDITWRARAPSHLGPDLPAELSFTDGRHVNASPAFTKTRNS